MRTKDDDLSRGPGERLLEGQDLPRPASKRLVALARDSALRQHIQAVMDGHSEHVDIDVGADFSVGFARCTHPDCRLVHLAADASDPHVDRTGNPSQREADVPLPFSPTDPF